MTPVLWLDPVAACAVTKAITPAVGLGQLVCATCRGRTRFEGNGFVCSDCNGSGLVQPSGPTTMLIATTARDLVNGERFGPWIVRAPVSSARMDGVTDPFTMFDPHVSGSRVPIHPASILGTATVELVPCYESGDWPDDLGTKWVRVSSGRLSLYDGDGAAYEINEALPFGPWTPGGLAAIVTDYRPTIDCPNRVDVERDGCGKWWVTLDGTRVSDHRDHVAARTAARRHPLATTVACPLPWPAAPSSPCVTTIDLGESGAA